MHSQCLRRVSSFAISAALLTSLAVLAQTTPNTTAPAKPAKAAPAPAPKPAAVKPVAKAAAPVSPQPARPAATSQPLVPALAPATATPTTTAGVQPITNPVTAQTASNALTSAPAASGGDPRAPVAGQGIGTFIWPKGWTLIAYGCFRSGTRLFCDFDTTSNNNTQAGVNIWSGAGGVNLVDDGGKITTRHNAFFVGDDGSQFTTAYVGQQPVRFIIEYDDVDQRYTSISLVLARNRIQSVPITLIDPSQPAGKMPARAAMTASAQGPQPAAQSSGTGVLDKAGSTVNNANAQKKKAQSLWKSVQDATQSH